MAQLNSKVQIRLTHFARFVLNATLALVMLTGIQFGKRWMRPFLSRSWVMRIGDGPWQKIIVDDDGRFRCARA